MIVYRSQQEVIDPAPTLRRLQQTLRELATLERPDFDALTEQLIDAGELASAVIDHLQPHVDDMHPAAAPWVELVTALATAADGAWTGEHHRTAGALRAAQRAACVCAQSFVPREVSRRVSEGFAYDALGPELYAEAARAWRAPSGIRSVVCVGLRTPGVVLAAAAAAAFEARGLETSVITVRPRGHAVDRRVAMTSRLTTAIRNLADAVFFVVDEGPGLSGSSLASVAEALSALGIDDRRIVLMPGHEPNVDGFSNAVVQRRWRRHTLCAPDFERVWIGGGKLAAAFGADQLDDLAAGQWRSRRPIEAAPAVHPQHERRKYAIDGNGRTRWIKFAGLGRYGRLTRERAEHAAASGWGPPVEGLRHGWLEMAEVRGCPGESACALPGPDRLADYLAFVRNTWVTGQPAAPESLLDMGVANITEVCGEDLAHAFERLFPSTPADAVRVDARQFPHEWLRSGDQLIKTDGVDHHDDHFFPGPVDIAWDLAGVLEEWKMAGDAEQAFLGRYEALTGDHTACCRLPFYRAAYLAFRAGYSTFASEQLGATLDGERFRNAASWYRDRLLQVLNA